MLGREHRPFSNTFQKLVKRPPCWTSANGRLDREEGKFKKIVYFSTCVNEKYVLGCFLPCFVLVLCVTEMFFHVSNSEVISYTLPKFFSELYVVLYSL